MADERSGSDSGICGKEGWEVVGDRRMGGWEVVGDRWDLGPSKYYINVKVQRSELAETYPPGRRVPKDEWTSFDRYN